MKKPYIVLAIILLFVLNAYSQKKGFFDKSALEYSNLKREPFVKLEKITTTLTLTYSNNDTVSFETELEKNSSAFDLLETITEREEIELFSQKDTNGNMVVTGIGEYRNNLSNKWEYTVNKNPATELPNNQIISNGDVIEFSYVPIK